MLLGALLDAGLPVDAVRAAVSALGIPGVRVDCAAAVRCEVRGARALVDVSEAPRYTPAQMLDAVAGANGLSAQTRGRATAVLKALFAAEARVHGHTDANGEGVHLDELGSADTLVDIVGVAHGLEYLGIGRIYAAPLVVGEATGPRRAGGYSNPAPATLEIIAAAGAPVAPERPFHAGAGELTTPTGAALITALADEFRQPGMTIARIGVGIGGKDPAAFPNVLRLWLGETTAAGAGDDWPLARWQDDVILLETNLDNATGEQLGFAMERLFAAGALDVWHTPAQMKKNRPGIILSALGPAHLEGRLAEAFLRDTPTLGVRVRPVGRYAAARDTITAATEYGPIRIKRKWLGDKVASAAPEHEDVAAAARAGSVSWQTVADAAGRAVIPGG